MHAGQRGCIRKRLHVAATHGFNIQQAAKRSIENCCDFAGKLLKDLRANFFAGTVTLKYADAYHGATAGGERGIRSQNGYVESVSYRHCCAANAAIRRPYGQFVTALSLRRHS
jgi:hypothetical protein